MPFNQMVYRLSFEKRNVSSSILQCLQARLERSLVCSIEWDDDGLVLTTIRGGRKMILNSNLDEMTQMSLKCTH